jgi:DNA replication and repair protein RecF
MQLKRLSLTNFRNFARLDIDVPDKLVLIVGSNAQGKTSILEAVYFLATLSSFHAEKSSELINFLEARNPLAVGRIVADYDKGGSEHHLEIRIIQESTRNGLARARKEVLLDGVKKKSREVLGHFNAVLFLPQMMQIIEGSPSERRRFLDLLLSQIVPHYAENLSEYLKVLGQRNALLKQLGEKGGERAQLAFWDERLAKRGAALIAERITALQELETLAGPIHYELTRTQEVLRLDYQPAYDPLPKPENQMQLLDAPKDRSKFSVEKIEQGFLEVLQKNQAREIRRGQTLLGPHRDEVRLLSNSVDLGIYGSRGQVRTAMMTLKLAEMNWMEHRTGEWPVLLLDEVLAELDEERRRDLLQHVHNGQQALLTTTDLHMFAPEFVEQARVWQIEGGKLKTV